MTIFLTYDILETCRTVQSEFIFSERRKFFTLIEDKVKTRIQLNIAWPDLLFFAQSTDFLESYQEVLATRSPSQNKTK